MKIQKKRIRGLAGFATLVLVLALGLSSVASAQDSARDTYRGDSPQSFVAAGGGSGGNGSADAADPGSLPFTGLDLGLALGGGLLLIGTGVALSRVMVREHQA